MTIYNRDGIIYKASYDRQGNNIYQKTDIDIPLSSVGNTVLHEALTQLNTLNPNGKYLSFAYITDLHQGSNGVTYADNGIVENIQSIKMLGKLSQEYNIDGVFIGGDLINARVEDRDNLRTNRQTVIDNFNTYLPNLNVFCTVGNHDKRYSKDNELITNHEIYEALSTLHSCTDKVKLHYIDETNYCVDFLEHKVRIIVMNAYDGVDSDPSLYASSSLNTASWSNGLNLENYNASEWLVGVVYHGTSYSGMRSYLEAYRKKISGYREWKNTNKEAGKGYLGVFAGHGHTIGYSDANCINSIMVSCAYATQSQLNTVNEYCFSIFVVDIDKNKFYEVRVGRSAEVLEFNIIDDDYKASNIRIYQTLTNCKSDYYTGNENAYEKWKKAYPHVGDSLSMNIIANDGYTLDGATVTITDNNVDITETAYNNGAINIDSVNGYVRITVTANAV